MESDKLLTDISGQNFCPYGKWRGTYTNIDLPPPGSNHMKDLLFSVVITGNQPDLSGRPRRIAYIVPQTWLDGRCMFFLYPPPDFHVKGLYPWKWGQFCYFRRPYPTRTWVEYELTDLVTETGPVTFEEAVKELKLLVEMEREQDSGYGESSGDSAFQLDVPSAKKPRLQSQSPVLQDLDRSPLSPDLFKSLTEANDTLNSTDYVESDNEEPRQQVPFRGVRKRPFNQTLFSNTASQGTQHETSTSTNMNGLENSSESISYNDVEVLGGLGGGNPPNNKDDISSKKSDFEAKVVSLLEQMVNLLTDLTRDPKTKRQEALTHNFQHFKNVVATNVKLPLQDPESIQLLNTALADMELSVCLCCMYIHKFRSLTSKDIIAKAVVHELMSNQLCTRVQWKPRGKDLRPGIGHLVNFISVGGVIIKNILENRGEIVLPENDVLANAIKNARRIISHQENEKQDAADVHVGKEKAKKDKSLIAIDHRIEEIRLAILKYRPSV